MQEEADYLEVTIPTLSDKELINILTVNAAAYSDLALELAIEELGMRGFKIEETEHGFGVTTPAGDELNFPRQVRTSSGTNGGNVDPGLAFDAHNRAPVGVGGWLGLLIFDLVIFRPLYFLVIVYVLGLGTSIMSYYPLLGWLTVLDKVSGAVIVGAGIYAGVNLYRLHPDAVILTKRFLVTSAACGTAVASLIYLAAIGTGVPAIKENASLIPAVIVLMWVNCGVWYLYLSHSKRVAATYGATAAESS